MKLLKSDLLPAVKFLSGISGHRHVMPFRDWFMLESDGAQLSIRATSGDQDATQRIPCDEQFDAFAVNSNYFTRLVQDSQEVINLTLSKDRRLLFESGFTHSMPTMDAKEFPARFGNGGTAQGCSTSDLANGIESVSWAISKDTSRQNLLNAHVVLAPQLIVCEASDGYVLARCAKPSIAGYCEFAINGIFTQQVVESLRQPNSNLFVAENCITVKHDLGEYSAKLTEHPFPSTKAIFEDEKVYVGEINVLELASHAQLAQSLSASDGLKVAMSFGPLGVTITSDHTDGAYSGFVGGEFEEFSVSVSARKLVMTLRSFKTETVKFFNSKNNRVVFSSGEYECYLCALVK